MNQIVMIEMMIEMIAEMIIEEIFDEADLTTSGGEGTSPRIKFNKRFLH